MAHNQFDLFLGEGQINAKNVKLNDNKWHEVRLNRVGRSFTISIDNAHHELGRECNLHLSPEENEGTIPVGITPDFMFPRMPFSLTEKLIFRYNKVKSTLSIVFVIISFHLLLLHG